MTMRVGQGVDVHLFEAGDHVMLCGVRIPHDRGVRAHSDGDVALHALCDALLGAAGLGDIGDRFPDDDARWAGADSRDLLRDVAAAVREREYRIGNVDITIVAQAPRVAPWRDQMRATLVQDLGVASDQVSVKATTTEGLGFTGRGEGIAAFAIVSLERV